MGDLIIVALAVFPVSVDGGEPLYCALNCREPSWGRDLTRIAEFVAEKPPRANQAISCTCTPALAASCSNFEA
ncbi:hypothetical protein C8R45DRAFT_960782 [Mycena sanguinolenta]|nr:hypothetical protein C8R45DRAFT_960782 [Mycena sanguinolenta]